MSARVRRSTGRSGWPEAPLTVALVLAMAPLVPPTVVLVLAMVPLVPPTVVLPTVVLVMLALLTVALSPADTRARRSELQQELKTQQ